ncbi:mixed lineage kinase domain-like protein isoform X2 [Acanthaster planci]|nr:mixed lineage kinase domain-like protein isoform X2 [Acanthaster planci]
MEVVKLAVDILQIAKKIFDVVEEVQHFKNRSRRLKHRIENLTPAIEKLASSEQAVPENARTPDGLKLFSKSLGQVLQLLIKIRDFIKSLDKWTFINKLLYKDRIGNQFDEYNDQLDCLAQAIHFSLAVENREIMYQFKNDKTDQDKDESDLIGEFQKGKEQILEQVARIAQGQEEVMKELHKIIAQRPALPTVFPTRQLMTTSDEDQRIKAELREIDPEQLESMSVMCTSRFGKIYKATYKQETVAVKSFSVSIDDSVKKVLLREAKNLLYLNSSYIVRLWGVCTRTDRCLLVFEYMEKGNLRDVLDEHGRDWTELPWARRIQMALDGALGLYRMHNSEPRPLMHQDLASDVFLVNASWGVKLSDVGFAETRTTIEKHSKPLRTNRTTLNYISPERLANINLRPTAHTDIYSYGIVMWEIATGSRPYEGYTDQQIEDFVLEKKDKLALPDDCLDGFKALIDQCRSVDPLTRPTSGEIVAKLQELRASLEQTWC